MANLFPNSIRIIKAVNLLASPNGTTVMKLVNSLGISRRSVFRLLNTLEELGFPIIDERPQAKDRKTYRLADSYVLKFPNISIPNPFLTSKEIIYIMALLDVCKQKNLLDDKLLLNSIIGKLEAMILEVDK